MSSIEPWIWAFCAVSGILACALLFATFVAIRRLFRRQPFGPLGFVVLLVWAGVVISGVKHDEMVKPSDPAKQTASSKLAPEVAQMVVLKQLKDPDSAKFGEIHVYDDRKLKGNPVIVACGSVNSKNGFGGYTGAQSFIVLGGSYQAVFDNDRDNSAFVALWNGLCAGKHS